METKGDTLDDHSRSEMSAIWPAHPYLFIVLECDRPLAGGARYRLTGIDEVIIGRGPERRAERESCGGVQRLSLQIPGAFMSGVHARLTRTPRGFRLEDAGAKNGTFVDGQRVQSALVADGNVIALGHTLLMVREAVPTPPQTPASQDLSSQDGEDLTFCTLLPGLDHELRTLLRAACSTLPVVLLGETGTGKEVVAREVHRASRRRGPFVAVNCGALAPNLTESLLFGHSRGSFSGAWRDEPGFFRAAEGGTLLLDEIGDFPLASQVALLRVLQEREVVPVGATRGLPIDVRIIAATHRSLDLLAGEGGFRNDLLGRLTGCRLTLPPLRARVEDLGLLVARILRQTQTTEATSEGGTARAHPAEDVKITPDAGLALLKHDWPLNVRELVQRLERALVLRDGPLITSALVSLDTDGSKPASSTSRMMEFESAEELALKKELLAALEHHRGNVAGVARALGKERMQIHRWLRRFGVDVADYRAPRRH